MEQTVFYLGIDGGGTKSTARLEFADGRPPVYLAGGPLNVCSLPYGEVAANLAALVDKAEDAAGGHSLCRGVGIGAAGLTNPGAEPFFRAQVMARLPGAPLALGTDALAALYGAHLGYEGIVLVSGTGSVCHGAMGPRSHQAGGCGHLIDDEGSGYAIGRDILAAVVQSLDGRLPATILSEAVEKHSGLASRGDIVGFVYEATTGKDDIAAFAPLLTAACKAGDDAALAIADKAAENLLALVSAVANTLPLPEGPLAFAGGILKKEPFVYEPLCKKLAKHWPKIVYYKAKADAATGAVLMARRIAGEEAP